MEFAHRFSDSQSPLHNSIYIGRIKFVMVRPESEEILMTDDESKARSFFDESSDNVMVSVIAVGNIINDTTKKQVDGFHNCGSTTNYKIYTSMPNENDFDKMCRYKLGVLIAGASNRELMSIRS